MTDVQIVGFLKQAEAGMSIKDIFRSDSFSLPTFYKWRSSFGGMEVLDAQKLAPQSANPKKQKARITGLSAGLTWGG
ncbi:transposase [Limnohabitans sp.]|uniref:transposase n=1 Tax=Limnohabitans sp. TaxID=1907725 RepID=UPI0039BD8A2B